MSHRSVAAVAALTAVAGVAHASQIQTFDTDPVIGSSQAPGVWYTDRFAPQVFESASFGGDNRLRMGMRESGQQANRAGGFSSDFYNYQGRKFDTPYNGIGTSISADLYVDSGWNDGARAGLWVTANNGNQTFPIIEYATDENGLTNGFRYWQSGIGWTDIASNVASDLWYRLEIGLTSTEVTFSITNLDDMSVLFSTSVDNQGATAFNNLILQGHNQGRAGEYDIHWDNVTTAIPLPTGAGLAGLGLGLVALRRRR